MFEGDFVLSGFLNTCLKYAATYFQVAFSL